VFKEKSVVENQIFVMMIRLGVCCGSDYILKHARREERVEASFSKKGRLLTCSTQQWVKKR